MRCLPRPPDEPPQRRHRLDLRRLPGDGMSARPIHAARPGLAGNHRTDAFPCRCDPIRLADMNEPGRVVMVHRPIEAATPDREGLLWLSLIGERNISNTCSYIIVCIRN